MATATFAQFCAHLANVTDSSASVFNLYSEASGTTEDTHFVKKWLISEEDFMNLFYYQGVFNIRDCCDNVLLLHNWMLDPTGTPAESAVPFGTDPSRCHLLSLITEQWILDASNNCGMDISSSNWETCSKMNMLGELLKSENLCNWKCNVCCALTAQELANVLNYQEYDAMTGLWTGDVIRTALNPINVGDCLILSILFTNDNPCVDPIELRLNFFIGVSRDDWINSAVARPPSPFFPGPTQWTALRVIANVPPLPPTIGVALSPGVTNRILIDNINCSGSNTQIPFDVSGAFKNYTLEVGGYSVNCPNTNTSISNGKFLITNHASPASLGVSYCQLDVIYQSGTPTTRWGLNPAVHTITILDP